MFDTLLGSSLRNLGQRFAAIGWLAVFNACVLFASPFPAAGQDSSSVIQAARAWNALSSSELAVGVASLPLSPEGLQWNLAPAHVLTPAASIVVELAAQESIEALILQGDDNDSYLVESSVDGTSWQWLWSAPPSEGGGIRSRFEVLDSPRSAKFLRIKPGSGDGNFSVTKILALRSVPDWWAGMRDARRVSSGFIPFLTETRVDAMRPYIAALGMLALVWCWLARSSGASSTIMTRGKILLGGSALAALLCWWNFFNYHYPRSVHYWDFYHYYMGAKYFPELGYTGLYECTARADLQDGFSDNVMASTIRDLHSNMLLPARDLLGKTDCKSAFSPARWDEFVHDVRWFRSRSSPARWIEQRQDHGFNGTPVWRLLPAALLSTLPLEEWSVTLLAAIDSFLLVLMWAVVYWCFGFEACCAALIFWGTNYPGRFYWTGGSLFRHDWLAWLIVSLCLLKKGFTASAGALFAYASLLRIFPGIALVGAAAHVLGRWIRTRTVSLERSEIRLAAGFLAALGILLAMGYYSSGRTAPYQEFIANSAKHLSTPLTNNMGLPVLVAFDPRTRAELTKEPSTVEPFALWKTFRVTTLQERKPLYWAIVGAFTILLVAAASKVPLWASVALGVTAIPMLTELTCYYYSVLAAVALLWPLTASAGIGLVAVSWLTGLCAQLFEWYDVRYTAMSFVVCIFCFAILLLLSFRRERLP